jgi:hypothetical protein
MLKPKKRRPGRPKIPERDVKGRYLVLRVTQDQWLSIDRGAKAKKQTLSAWIRSTLEQIYLRSSQE